MKFPYFTRLAPFAAAVAVTIGALPAAGATNAFAHRPAVSKSPNYTLYCQGPMTHTGLVSDPQVFSFAAKPADVAAPGASQCAWLGRMEAGRSYGVFYVTDFNLLDSFHPITAGQYFTLVLSGDDVNAYISAPPVMLGENAFPWPHERLNAPSGLAPRSLATEPPR